MKKLHAAGAKLKSIVISAKDSVCVCPKKINSGLSASNFCNSFDCEFANGYEGYYTEHYELIKGLYSRVCKGSVELRFNDDASVEPLSRERLGVVLSQIPPDEFEELLVTLDSERAYNMYNSFPIPPLKWDAETRTINVEIYYLETEDCSEGDMALYYKCDALTQEVICGTIK
jgi:hypothetical protein